MESPVPKIRHLFTALLVLGSVAGSPGIGAAETDADDPPNATSPAAADEVNGESKVGSDEHDTATESNQEESEREFFGERHRRKLYKEGRLHYSTAALRTALLPGLGNFYAEQYLLGGLHASLMGFALVIVPYGLATDQPVFIWSGAGVAGAAYISGFVTSAIGVRRYNRRLRRRLRLTTTPESARPPRPGSGTPWALPRATTIPVLSIPF